MKLKLGTLCLALLLLVSIWIPGAAEGVPEIEVTVPTVPVKAGEPFEVLVSIQDNPGFYAADFSLKYDRTLMSCQDVQAKELIQDTLYATNPGSKSGALLSLATVSGVLGDGLLFSVIFTPLKDLDSFEFHFSKLMLADSDGKVFSDISVEFHGLNEGSETAGTDGQTNTEEPAPTEGESSNAEETQSDGNPGGGEGTDDPSMSQESENAAETPSDGSAAEQGSESGPASGASSGSENGTPDGTPPGSGSAQGSGSESGNDSQESLPIPRLSDIQGHWAEESILRAASLGLIKGYEDGTFKPDQNITRAQFITLLYRMAGSPEVTEETPFKDISNQIPEFRSAIAWAYQNGYANGTGEDTFSPTSYLTRQEAVTLLFRYSGGQSGLELMFFSVYDEQFVDSGEVAGWARNAMYWGVFQGIINGTSETTLSPQGNATRAQIAKILVYYLDRA